MRIRPFFAILLLCAAAGANAAPPPPTVNVQGSLASSEGDPLLGNRAYRVRFFDAETAGTQLGGDLTGTTIFSGGGIFNFEVALPTPVLAVPASWYELALDSDEPDDGIDGDDVFEDRFKVNSVPFALLAANSNLLEGTPAADFATDSELATAIAGVDAEIMDLLDSPQFLRSDVSDEFTGAKLTLNGALEVGQEGLSSHDVNIYGASSGGRLHWDASKNALRGGRVEGAQWDAANIGLDSVALGFNTTASGDYSAAIGFGPTASGKYGIAIGYKTEAGGDYSTAIGYESVASGVLSTAIGNQAVASGGVSTAMGSITTAGGATSTAMGLRTVASGGRSTAMGGFTVASGDYSLAAGRLTEASAPHSTALGFGARATGDVSTAMGRSTIASGTYSTAMGHGSMAIGEYSTALGLDTVAGGKHSLAAGRLARASGSTAIALGYETIASGARSVAMGRSTLASGDFSTALGLLTAASGNSSTAIGQRTTASGSTSTAIGYGIEAEGAFSVGVGLGPVSGTVVAQDNTMAIVGGKVGIGSVAPTTRLFVEDEVSGFVMTLVNEGDNESHAGIEIQAGADDGSGTTNYILARDGDGGTVGSIRNVGGTFAVADLSDVRSKTNIRDTEVDALAIVEGLRVVDFNRKSNPDGPIIHGFIAQEAQQVFPEMVTQLDEDLLGISKDALIPILTKALQEQQRLISEQRNDYEAKIAELRRMIVDGRGAIEK